MIEIKCTMEQKEKILLNLMMCNDVFCDAFTPDECKSVKDCKECVNKNIKWDIRGNEDAE